jgi:hypothetical protein
MKSKSLFFTLAITALFLSCSNPIKTVILTPKISIGLPENYKVTGEGTQSSPKTYSATFNQDKINVFKEDIPRLDSMKPDKKKESIKVNVDRFIQTFNGRQLTGSDKTIGEVMINDFSFEFERRDSTFLHFGRFMIDNSNIFLLSYQTVKPMTKESQKSKDKFFDSLKIQ